MTPEVGFSLYHNGTVVFELLAGNFRKRIVSLFGNSMNQSLVPVQTETSIARIFDLLANQSLPGERLVSNIFVNGRYMKHPFFHKAVIQGYENPAPDLIPSYFICFEVDPEVSISIFIRPKPKLNLSSESAVWQMLHAAVREALGKFNVGPSIDFDQEGNPGIPISLKSTDGLVFPPFNIIRIIIRSIQNLLQ